ncbi:class I SAM-dependent methyltransferase [uncultured Roseibium sp.]|uniref:class I SAM-dependent methyltransferase n=1 Tax=uncultured Roseibium sp. TaxID=1936171 RepID=UPI002601E0F3|nr:class I SAM-dependent methyltransferase [uncultured Roseibium sp.]
MELASATYNRTSVAEGYGDSIRKRWIFYDLLTNKVADLASAYLPEEGLVIDLGCGTGEVAKRLEPTLKIRDAKYIGVDQSEEMFSEASDWLTECDGRDRLISFEIGDLRDRFRAGLPASVVILNLTLMYIPPEDRQFVVEAAYSSLSLGGALIIADRVDRYSGYFSEVVRLSDKHDFFRSGMEFSRNLRVIGFERPLSEGLVSDMDEFFRVGEISGYIKIKG